MNKNKKSTQTANLSISDAPWSELSPKMQQMLAEKMLRLREYLGLLNNPEAKQPKINRTRVNELQKSLESKPWYKALRTHMAFRNGVPVGMITTRPEKDSGSVYVDNLFVDPKHRGRGVGYSLMQSVINRAKAAGATQIRLGVDYKNMAARKLYDSLGLMPESMLLKKEL